MKKRSHKIGILFLITFTVAMCSIIYELLLSHTMSFVTGNTVFWYGIVIGIYLGSLGIGSFAVVWIEKKEALFKNFFRVELALAIIGGGSVVFVFFAHMVDAFFIVQGFIQIGKYVFFGIVFFVVIAVGFLSGVELPLLIKIGKNYAGKSIMNRVLAIDYFGSLVGAVVFPLFLVPKFNIITIGFLSAFLNLIVVFIFFSFTENGIKKMPRKNIVGFLIIIFLLYAGLIFSNEVDQYFARKYYNYLTASRNLRSLLLSLDENVQIERNHSRYQVIDIVDTKLKASQDILMEVYKNKQCGFFSQYNGTELYLNGDWQFNAGTERIYHEYFAHVPIILAGKVPKKVLVLGGGDGLIDRELLKYREVERIVHVDLDREIIELAKSHSVLSSINEEALNDNRVKLIIDDGFSFVKKETDKYDAVYIDFPTPFDYNVAKLYSREFYTFVRNVVSEDGFIVFDIPGVGSYFSYDEDGHMKFDQKNSPLDGYYDTVRSSGFETVVPFLSQLESDNQMALLVAKDHFTENIREKNRNFGKIKNSYLLEKKNKQEAKEFVRNFVLKTQEGFIFATKNKIDINKKYVSFGAKMCILNEKRFLLSNSFPFKLREEIDQDNVNSIMKPVISRTKHSQIKLPYYLQ